MWCLSTCFFVFFLRHNSEFPALSPGWQAVGKKIAASFRFHFRCERENYKSELINDNDDDGDVGDSRPATDDDLRSNMARTITLWGGIIIPSGAHWCTFAHHCTSDIGRLPMGAHCYTFVHPQLN